MTNLPTVLVVDDEQSIRESFNLILSGKCRLLTAASGEAAVKYAADEKPDVVFLDIRMPGMDGLETLKRIKGINNELLVIMVTAVNDVQKASEAIKYGAYDYVVKPFDVTSILNLTSNLLMKRSLLAESRKVSQLARVPVIIGSSERIEKVRQLSKEASEKKGGVLILGPEGVEKEAVARSIAFVQTYDLRQSYSMLFGKSSGSTVTDLIKTTGALDLAKDGSIFIDHAELMPPWAQEKLLQYHVRLILGTSVNLKESGFNQTLYEKVSETVIEIPPVLERASDIPLIVDYLLDEANKRYLRKVKGFSPEAQNLLYAYPWPGNTTQLMAVIFNLVLLSEKPIIEAEDLPLDIITHEASFYSLPLEEVYSKFEEEHIQEVMKAVGSDREKAAKILGISLKVLETKL